MTGNPSSLIRAALCALLCLVLLAAPGPLGLSTPAFARSTAAASAPAMPSGQAKEESCGRGKATKEFGWRVVEFGVSTLKYLIGLFIIPIGLFLVVVGSLLQIVEAVAC